MADFEELNFSYLGLLTGGQRPPVRRVLNSITWLLQYLNGLYGHPN